MRLRLVPQETKWDFFSRPRPCGSASRALLIVAAMVSFFIQGLNFGIDFRGGTTIRTESTQEVVVADYRAAIQPLEPWAMCRSLKCLIRTLKTNQYVTMIRIQAQEGQEAVTADVIRDIEAALKDCRAGYLLSCRSNPLARKFLVS